MATTMYTMNVTTTANEHNERLDVLELSKTSTTSNVNKLLSHMNTIKKTGVGNDTLYESIAKYLGVNPSDLSKYDKFNVYYSPDMYITVSLKELADYINYYYNNLVSEPSEYNVLFECGASWCTPCWNIIPHFPQLTTQYKNLTVISFNVTHRYSTDASASYSYRNSMFANGVKMFVVELYPANNKNGDISTPQFSFLSGSIPSFSMHSSTTKSLVLANGNNVLAGNNYETVIKPFLDEVQDSLIPIENNTSFYTMRYSPASNNTFYINKSGYQFGDNDNRTYNMNYFSSDFDNFKNSLTKNYAINVGKQLYEDDIRPIIVKEVNSALSNTIYTLKPENVFLEEDGTKYVKIDGTWTKFYYYNISFSLTHIVPILNPATTLVESIGERQNSYHAESRAFLDWDYLYPTGATDFNYKRNLPFGKIRTQSDGTKHYIPLSNSPTVSSQDTDSSNISTYKVTPEHFFENVDASGSSTEGWTVEYVLFGPSDAETPKVYSFKITPETIINMKTQTFADFTSLLSDLNSLFKPLPYPPNGELTDYLDDPLNGFHGRMEIVNMKTLYTFYEIVYNNTNLVLDKYLSMNDIVAIYNNINPEAPTADWLVNNNMEDRRTNLDDHSDTHTLMKCILDLYFPGQNVADCNQAFYHQTSTKFGYGRLVTDEFKAVLMSGIYFTGQVAFKTDTCTCYETSVSFTNENKTAILNLISSATAIATVESVDDTPFTNSSAFEALKQKIAAFTPSQLLAAFPDSGFSESDTFSVQTLSCNVEQLQNNSTTFNCILCLCKQTPEGPMDLNVSTNTNASGDLLINIVNNGETIDFATRKTICPIRLYTTTTTANNPDKLSRVSNALKITDTYRWVTPSAAERSNTNVTPPYPIATKIDDPNSTTELSVRHVVNADESLITQITTLYDTHPEDLNAALTTILTDNAGIYAGTAEDLIADIAQSKANDKIWVIPDRPIPLSEVDIRTNNSNIKLSYKINEFELLLTVIPNGDFTIKIPNNILPSIGSETRIITNFGSPNTQSNYLATSSAGTSFPRDLENNPPITDFSTKRILINTIPKTSAYPQTTGLFKLLVYNSLDNISPEDNSSVISPENIDIQDGKTTYTFDLSTKADDPNSNSDYFYNQFTLVQVNQADGNLNTANWPQGMPFKNIVPYDIGTLKGDTLLSNSYDSPLVNQAKTAVITYEDRKFSVIEIKEDGSKLVPPYIKETKNLKLKITISDDLVGLYNNDLPDHPTNNDKRLNAIENTHQANKQLKEQVLSWKISGGEDDNSEYDIVRSYAKSNDNADHVHIFSNAFAIHYDIVTKGEASEYHAEYHTEKTQLKIFQPEKGGNYNIASLNGSLSTYNEPDTHINLRLAQTTILESLSSTNDFVKNAYDLIVENNVDPTNFGHCKVEYIGGDNYGNRGMRFIVPGFLEASHAFMQQMSLILPTSIAEKITDTWMVSEEAFWLFGTSNYTKQYTNSSGYDLTLIQFKIQSSYAPRNNREEGQSQNLLIECGYYDEEFYNFMINNGIIIRQDLKLESNCNNAWLRYHDMVDVDDGTLTGEQFIYLDVSLSKNTFTLNEGTTNLSILVQGTPSDTLFKTNTIQCIYDISAPSTTNYPEKFADANQVPSDPNGTTTAVINISSVSENVFLLEITLNNVVDVDDSSTERYIRFHLDPTKVTDAVSTQTELTADMTQDSTGLWGTKDSLKLYTGNWLENQLGLTDELANYPDSLIVELGAVLNGPTVLPPVQIGQNKDLNRINDFSVNPKVELGGYYTTHRVNNLLAWAKDDQTLVTFGRNYQLPSLLDNNTNTYVNFSLPPPTDNTQLIAAFDSILATHSGIFTHSSTDLMTQITDGLSSNTGVTTADVVGGIITSDDISLINEIATKYDTLYVAPPAPPPTDNTQLLAEFDTILANNPGLFNSSTELMNQITEQNAILGNIQFAVTTVLPTAENDIILSIANLYDTLYVAP